MTMTVSEIITALTNLMGEVGNVPVHGIEAIYHDVVDGTHKISVSGGGSDGTDGAASDEPSAPGTVGSSTDVEEPKAD